MSLTNATLGVGSELGWVAYTLQGSLWSAIPEAALMAATNLLLARALMRAGTSFARPVTLATIWGMTLIVATLLGGWAFLGALLPVAYGVQVVPSIWSAYRTWAPSGVSVVTWVTILVECLLWGTYGVARQDAALTTLGVIGSGAALAIVVRVLWTRDRLVDQGAQLHGRVEIEAAIPLGAGSLAVAGVCRDHRQEAAWVDILRVDLDRPGQLVPCRPKRCPAKLGAGAGRRVEQQEPGVGERLGVIRPLLQDLRVQVLGAPGRRRSAPVPGRGGRPRRPERRSASAPTARRYISRRNIHGLNDDRRGDNGPYALLDNPADGLDEPCRDGRSIALCGGRLRAVLGDFDYGVARRSGA